MDNSTGPEVAELPQTTDCQRIAKVSCVMDVDLSGMWAGAAGRMAGWCGRRRGGSG